MIRQRRYCIDD